LHRELEGEGFSIIAVAIDEDPEEVRPWVEEAGATFPVIVDRDHLIAERYHIVNVPTVVWIDENDRIVRPNDVAFPSDLFKDFHGIDSAPHLESLRRWVTEGVVEFDADAAREHQVLPTDDEQLARLHHRVALELHRRGRTEAAGHHFDVAGRLAPDDFTIRRGSLPLRGIDPFFSEEFISLYEGWKDAGGRYYGISERR
jgi:hypothetical protein